MFSNLLQVVLQDLSSKIPQAKNAFLGQKMTFFQKVHFIQKCSVTQNTVFQNVKNNFLLSQNKLVFFTILNLHIGHYTETYIEWVAASIALVLHLRNNFPFYSSDFEVSSFKFQNQFTFFTEIQIFYCVCVVYFIKVSYKLQNLHQYRNSE